MTTVELARRARRIGAMSLPELAVRTRQAVTRALDRRWGLLHRGRDGAARTASSGLLVPVPGLAACDAVAAYVARRWPAARAAIVGAADRLLAGQVAVFGIPARSDNGRPAWHVDPASGRRAPDGHWSEVPYLNAAVVGDGRIVWELNRHQFLVTLGQAYRLTGDERYARHAWRLVDGWMDENPPEHGINWASSLEVALRAVVWCWVWHLAAGASLPTARERTRFLDGLRRHGRHIEAYLSTYFSPNTHLTGEALALCYLATCVGDGTLGDRWWRKGSRILLTELERQVGVDGMHFERSACYHLYTLDFYLHFAQLSRQRGKTLDTGLRARLVAMADVTRTLQRPDGLVASVGDDDGGRLLPLDGGDARDPSVSLAVAAALLGAPGLWPAARDATEACAGAVWLLGVEGFERAERDGGGPAADGRRVLPVAGLIRGGDDRDFMLASVGIQRAERQCVGHAHDDALAIELWCAGGPVLIDPGTLTYTGDPERRRAYRAAASHNAPTVDGWPGPPPRDPFRWAELRGGTLSAVDLERGYTVLEMERTLGPPESAIRHRRRIVGWHGVGWLVWDRLLGSGTHDVRLRYQFPNEQVRAGRSRRLVLLPHAVVGLAGGLADQARLRCEDSPVSPGYGRLVPACAWVVEGRVSLPADLLAIVMPRTAGSEDLVVGDHALPSPDAAPAGRTVALTAHGGALRHRIFLAESPGAAAPAGIPAAECTTVWLRNANDRWEAMRVRPGAGATTIAPLTASPEVGS